MPGKIVLAQTSANVTLTSDYRYRGISLSDGEAEAQINLGYDNPDGWYAGGFASNTKLYYANTEQLITYTGYAARISPGVSWEAGASTAHFLKQAHYNYTEAFAGLSSDNYSARIYFSPHYFGQNASTLYAEINASRQIQEHLQLMAHLGYLRPISVLNGVPSTTSTRVDTKLGLGTNVGNWNAQLAWVRIVRNQAIMARYMDHHSNRLVFSLGNSF